MYKNTVRITLSLAIDAKDVPGIKVGDELSNSRNREGYELIFDGGIDLRAMATHRSQKVIKRLQEEGKGIIVSGKGKCFQYVIRKQQER